MPHSRGRGEAGLLRANEHGRWPRGRGLGGGVAPPGVAGRWAGRAAPSAGRKWPVSQRGRGVGGAEPGRPRGGTVAGRGAAAAEGLLVLPTKPILEEPSGAGLSLSHPLSVGPVAGEDPGSKGRGPGRKGLEQRPPQWNQFGSRVSCMLGGKEHMSDGPSWLSQAVREGKEPGRLSQGWEKGQNKESGSRDESGGSGGLLPVR